MNYSILDLHKLVEMYAVYAIPLICDADTQKASFSTTERD